MNAYRIENNIAIITLTQNKEATVDVSDLKRVLSLKWSAYKGRKTYYAHARYKGNNRNISLHRFILENILCNPNEVDHKDGNGLNNTRSNLRVATSKQNRFNMSKRSGNATVRSRYKGVTWAKSRNKWLSCIRINGKTINLGRYEKEIDAAKAYNVAAIKYFGEFARINEV